MADEKTAEKAEFYKMLALSPEERAENGLPLDEEGFHQRYGVSMNTLRKWRSKRSNGDPFSLQNFLGENRQVLAEALLEAAKNKRTNAQALKLFAQLTGDLVEKKEETQKVEFTPADFYQLTQRVIGGLRRQLEEGGRICPVCHRPGVLLQEVCEDTGQDKTESD